MPAQSTVQHGVVPGVSLVDVFRSQDSFLASLNSLSIFPALLLAASGVVYLLYGWKVFKGLVIFNALFLGALLGAHLGSLLRNPDMPIYAAIGGGALMAMLAWPTMKYAVCLMGGLAGSLLGFGIWVYAAHATNNVESIRYAWAGAVLGLVVLGLLAFIVFRVTVISWTSFQGAVMVLAGSLALLLKHQQFHESIYRTFSGNVHLLPLLVAVPAGIGFIFQDASAIKKTRKKKPSGSGAG